MLRAKSFKVYISKTGTPLMSIIVHPGFTAEKLTKLFRDGLNVTVVDTPSALVDKNYVD